MRVERRVPGGGAATFGPSQPTVSNALAWMRKALIHGAMNPHTAFDPITPGGAG